MTTKKKYYSAISSFLQYVVLCVGEKCSVAVAAGCSVPSWNVLLLPLLHCSTKDLIDDGHSPPSRRRPSSSSSSTTCCQVPRRLMTGDQGCFDDVCSA